MPFEGSAPTVLPEGVRDPQAQENDQGLLTAFHKPVLTKQCSQASGTGLKEV